MLYQKLLTENNAYLLYVSDAADFPLHRHPEIELSYCLKGTYRILVNGKDCRLQEGDLAVINAMVPHEMFQDEIALGHRLTVEFGPSFLKEHFSTVANLDFDIALYRLNRDPGNKALRQLLEETALLGQNKTGFSNLTLKGNLYHISAFLLQALLTHHSTDTSKQTVQDIARIEKSLQLIYDHYKDNLELEQVSQLCGYSKSHFCRVFKSIVGDTFHTVLNRHRIEIACLHLKETNASVESIAVTVGFADAKNFCRVFKKITGTSPNSYRRTARSQN